PYRAAVSITGPVRTVAVAPASRAKLDSSSARAAGSRPRTSMAYVLALCPGRASALGHAGRFTLQGGSEEVPATRHLDGLVTRRDAQLPVQATRVRLDRVG